MTKQDARLPRWRSWYRLWMWVFLLVALCLLVVGALTRPVFAVAALVLPCVLGMVMGLIEITVPERFLAWREADANHGPARDVVRGFDQTFGIRRDHDGHSDKRSLQRTRHIGAVVLAVSAIMTAGVIGAYHVGIFP